MTSFPKTLNTRIKSTGIFVILFAAQRFGTDKVGYSFAPIVSLYFLLIGGIGLYNLVHYEIGVLRAFNPKYIVHYFGRNGKQGWVSLGGVLLCYTGNSNSIIENKYSLIYLIWSF
jgi:KUP system potassium uptake protein